MQLFGVAVSCCESVSSVGCGAGGSTGAAGPTQLHSMQSGSKQPSTAGQSFAGSSAVSFASGALSEPASADLARLNGPRHMFAVPDEILVEGSDDQDIPQGVGTVGQFTAAAIGRGGQSSGVKRHVCLFLHF